VRYQLIRRTRKETTPCPAILNSHGDMRDTDRRQFLRQYGGGLGGLLQPSLHDADGPLAAPYSNFKGPARHSVLTFRENW
jgi:hypothetical protein